MRVLTKQAKENDYCLCTRCVWKVTGLVSQTIYFSSEQYGVHFKEISLEANALFHSSLPQMEGFFWDAPQLHRYSTLDGLHSFKTVPLDDPLELGEKKKVTWGKIIEYGGSSRIVIFLSVRNFRILCTPSLVTFQTCLDLRNIVIFCVQLICDHLNRQLTISIYLLPFPLNVKLSSAYWSPPPPPTPGVIFQLLTTFFEPLVPRVRDLVLSPYTCWSISSACDGVFSTVPEISSMAIIERAEKESV